MQLCSPKIQLIYAVANTVNYTHLQNERMIGVQVSVKADHSILHTKKYGSLDQEWKLITYQHTQHGQQ